MVIPSSFLLGSTSHRNIWDISSSPAGPTPSPWYLRSSGILDDTTPDRSHTLACHPMTLGDKSSTDPPPLILSCRGRVGERWGQERQVRPPEPVTREKLKRPPLLPRCRRNCFPVECWSRFPDDLGWEVAHVTSPMMLFLHLILEVALIEEASK